MTYSWGKSDVCIKKDIYKDAYTLMYTARSMTHIFEENKEVTSKYVHATSAGHEQEMRCAFVPGG